MSPALILHIAAGSVGIVTGAVALAARKGEGVHRAAGAVFVGAMILMGAMAAYLAATIPQRGNLVGGLFTVYLVASGWMAVRRAPGRTGAFEIYALIFGLGVAAAGIVFGLMAAGRPTGVLDGKPPANFYIVAAIAVLATGLDLKVILSGGIAGVARVLRHLWRMCVGLFIATGSFFIGQQQVMPTVIQGSPLLYALALAPLVLMVFWLVRVRFNRRSDAEALAA